MRLPRFRVRVLLLLVMLAGVGTGGIVLWGRSVEYGRQAREWRDMEGLHELMYQSDARSLERERDFALKYGYLPDVQASIAELAVSSQRSRIRKDFTRALRRKYERAARYPWLPVAPDLPEPELPRLRVRIPPITFALAVMGGRGYIAWDARRRECSREAEFCAAREDISRKGAASFRDLLPEAQALAEDVKRDRDRITASGEVQYLAAQEFLEAQVRDEDSRLRAAIAKSERAAGRWKRRKEENRRAALFPWLAVPPFELDGPE